MTETHHPSASTPPSIRRRGRRATTAAAAVYAALSLGALLAWWFAGDAWWAQPLNVTTFWWSLPSVPLALMAVLSRRWRIAALLTLPAVIFLWSYGGQFVPSVREAAAPPDLRVATFNTLVHTPDIQHIEALVAAADPDVLLLQEIFPERQQELLGALSDRYPYSWFGDGRLVGGVGVLSSFPVADVREVAGATPHARPTAVVHLDVDGRAVQAVALHLTSPCLSCGDSLSARLDAEAAARAAEIEAVLAALDPDVPAVVAGDFNSTDRSGPYRQLVEVGFEDPHAEVGVGPGFTWPADAPQPWLRVDWVLVRGLESVRSTVGDAGPSDHRPVIVDLSFGG